MLSRKVRQEKESKEYLIDTVNAAKNETPAFLYHPQLKEYPGSTHYFTSQTLLLGGGMGASL